MSSSVVKTTVENCVHKYPLACLYTLPEHPLFNGKSLYTVREFRKELNSLKSTDPCCVQFWKHKMNYTLSKNNWSIAYNSPKETRLRVLHWKLLHNIYPTNILLHKMKVVDNNKCSFCPDKIEHFFFECPAVQLFWKKIEQYILNKLNIKIQLTIKEILFGIDKLVYTRSYDIKLINHLILIGKMCVSIYKKTKAKCPLYVIYEREVELRKRVSHDLFILDTL